MTAKEIYDILRANGLTRAGALGMLGNMMAESGLKPNIAQRGMTKLTDDQYTAAADNGLLDFVHDAVGYGLCQWTYHTRKQALLEAAKYQGVSVGDGAFQVQFCLDELIADFPSVYKTLCSSNNIDECTDLVCTRYESPAVNNFRTRRNFAYEFEKEIPEYTPPIKDPVKATFPPDSSVKMIQYAMWDNGYWDLDKINGYKSKEFFAKLQEFLDDMKKC